VSGDAEVVSVRGAAQDITERKERERTLNALLSATRAFIRANDRDELVTAVTDGADAVFDYEITSVRLHDRAAGTLPPTHVSPGAAEYVTDPPTFDVEGSAAGAAFRSGEPRVVDDLAADTDHDYGPLGSAAFIPLGDHGVLGIGAMERGTFDEGDVALVELLAVAAASAFDRLEQESEMRNLQRIIDHVDQKVFLLDEEGRFAYATSALAAYLGRDRDQLVGTPLRDVVAPDDRDGCEDALDEVRSRVQNVDPEAGAEADSDGLTVEAEVGLSDGDRRPAQIELSSVGRPDVAAAVAGVVTDISELAATRSSLATERERFRELFENLPDPVAEVEFVGSTPIVRYVNPAFTEVFGYERTTAHGANLNELIVPETERVGAADLDSGAMRGEVTSAEVTRGATDGPRSFLLRGIPYSREGGTHGFAVYTDITEQKERERYLTVLNRVLRHNLRNDMTVVMALARRLARQVTDETLAGYARTLLDNAEDVATLSEKAKEIERVLGRRDGDGQTVPVDLAAKVRTTVAEQTDTHPCVELSVDVPDVLWVEGDDTIRRACEELVENAIEHSESESPQVAVEAREDPERDGWVELRVRDDGPGIPGSEWQIVTGEEEISQLSHGSGLGLWLTRWIVESHGGEIYRERSGDGAGTTVVLRLRRADPGSSAEPIGEREFA
jgi:PAS domain S-box-containing protein